MNLNKRVDDLEKSNGKPQLLHAFMVYGENDIRLNDTQRQDHHFSSKAEAEQWTKDNGVTHFMFVEFMNPQGIYPDRK